LLTYWAGRFRLARGRTRAEPVRAVPDRSRRDDDPLRARAGRHGGGIPLLLSHGWPSRFAELLPLVPLLTDPAAHGIAGPAFDVVIPSLPGYGFSARPAVPGGVTCRYVAGLWHELMRGLGCERYAAGGGDFGAGIATFMALDDPGPCSACT
jgi:pimeloyl-ACP methyl ester carboxylesterase